MCGDYSWPPAIWTPRSGHPHVRGDYSTRPASSRSRFGPSPRAWGLRRGLREDEEVHRAIPTCVGTTGGGGPPGGARSGHPHVRGDYRGPTTGRSSGAGPSPRAWGLRGHGEDPAPAHRAIPTCVGTTVPVFLRHLRPPGHPHVRGDYSHQRRLAFRRDGPSPRAWGLHREKVLAELRARAIPTCVGTTESLSSSAALRTGPSPRAWGLRRRTPPSGCAGRAIPTCVGTTRYAAGSQGRGAGHPHVRGDYEPNDVRAVAEHGPSPRAWGLLHRPHRGERPTRAIPTCVGTTTGRPPHQD